MNLTAQATRLGQLAADEWGVTDDRPTLVLMHGLTFDRHMWYPTVDALQAIDPGRHVLAVDLPGHGDSPAAAEPQLGDGSRAIARGLSDSGLGAPVLVGHSAAAMEATFAAGEYPTRGVVNVDTALQIEGTVTMLRQLAARYHRDYRAMWDDVLLPSLRVDQLPEPAQRLLAAHCTPTPEIFAAGWAELLDGPLPELSQQLTAVLDKLRTSGMPYLTVFGDEPTPDYRAWLAAELPQAAIEVWPGHTHFPHLADPARFARLLATTGGW